MKSVIDFLPDHDTNSDVVILGQCPSSKVTPCKNGTFARLKTWMNMADQPSWAFHNVIPNKINSYKMEDVDESALFDAVHDKKLVIALGGFVSRVCKKYNIDHIKIDHPSPRNRNLNSIKYELSIIQKIHDEISLYKDEF